MCYLLLGKFFYYTPTFTSPNGNYLPIIAYTMFQLKITTEKAIFYLQFFLPYTLTFTGQSIMKELPMKNTFFRVNFKLKHSISHDG